VCWRRQWTPPDTTRRTPDRRFFLRGPRFAVSGGAGNGERGSLKIPTLNPRKASQRWGPGTQAFTVTVAGKRIRTSLRTYQGGRFGPRKVQGGTIRPKREFAIIQQEASTNTTDGGTGFAFQKTRSAHTLPGEQYVTT